MQLTTFLQGLSAACSADHERQGPASVPRVLSTLGLRYPEEPAPGQALLRDFWVTSSTSQPPQGGSAHSHGKNLELGGWDHLA